MTSAPKKDQMVSVTCALLKWIEIEVEEGSRAAAPKEPMTYAFTHEEICPSPSSSGWELGLWDEV